MGRGEWGERVGGEGREEGVERLGGDDGLRVLDE